MSDIPEKIVYIARRMFERHLTDISGGNISAFENGTLYITPKYSGSQQHWQLQPEAILSGKLEDDWLNHPRFSREGRTHLSIYRIFPFVSAVIHAHPFHILPFCAASKPIPPIMENTQKFGVIQVVPPSPAHSQELADNVVAALNGQEERMQKQAAAVLVPKHGIFVAGKDLFAALDALERLDWNAWCILAQKWMD